MLGSGFLPTFASIQMFFDLLEIETAIPEIETALLEIDILSRKAGSNKLYGGLNS